jgi:hypothetical protein
MPFRLASYFSFQLFLLYGEELKLTRRYIENGIPILICRCLETEPPAPETDISLDPIRKKRAGSPSAGLCQVRVGPQPSHPLGVSRKASHSRHGRADEDKTPRLISGNQHQSKLVITGVMDIYKARRQAYGQQQQTSQASFSSKNFLGHLHGPKSLTLNFQRNH